MRDNYDPLTMEPKTSDELKKYYEEVYRPFTGDSTFDNFFKTKSCDYSALNSTQDEEENGKKQSINCCFSSVKDAYIKMQLVLYGMQIQRKKSNESAKKHLILDAVHNIVMILVYIGIILYCCLR